MCGGTLDAPLPSALPPGFPCHICGKTLRSALKLVAHSAKHTGINQFFCTLCPRNFDCPVRLHEHLEAFHHAPSLVGSMRKLKGRRPVADGNDGEHDDSKDEHHDR
jgi:transcription elongation factor Elf1